MNLNVKNWITKFLSPRQQLEESIEPELPILRKAELFDVVANLRRPLVVFVDYDGTLFPIVRRPELASPDSSLMMLLKKLSRTPGVELHIISGRRFEELFQWFHKIPIHIHAEHGGISYDPVLKRKNFVLEPTLDPHLMQNVQTLFESFKKQHPGILIEHKSYSTVLHYRMADIDDHEAQMNLWKHDIQTLVGVENIDIMEGDKYLEVRIKGICKSQVFQRRVQRSSDSQFVVIGSNCLEDEILRSLKEPCLTLSVGDKGSLAHHILRDSAMAREFIRVLDGHFNNDRTSAALNTLLSSRASEL